MLNAKLRSEFDGMKAQEAFHQTLAACPLGRTGATENSNAQLAYRLFYNASNEGTKYGHSIQQRRVILDFTRELSMRTSSDVGELNHQLNRHVTKKRAFSIEIRALSDA